MRRRNRHTPGHATHLDDEPATSGSLHDPPRVSDESARGEREGVSAVHGLHAEPFGQLHATQRLRGPVPGQGGPAVACLENHPGGPAVRDRLLPGLAQERGHPAGSRSELQALAAAADRRQGEGRHGRQHRENDDELEEGYPSRVAAAAGEAHLVLPSLQLVTSPASPSPPAEPSEPSEVRSYSPCSPGLLYW